MHADALDGGVEWFAANGELEPQSREAAESLRVAAQCIRVEIVGGFAVFQAVGRVRGRRGQTIGTNGTDAIPHAREVEKVLVGPKLNAAVADVAGPGR